MSPPLPGKGRRATALAAAALVAAGLAVYGGTAAGAAPRPTIAQVQAKVNSLQAQVDQVGQQYGEAGQQLAAARARLAAVQRQDGRAEARYSAARAQLRQIAVAQYENPAQSPVAGLLAAGDPAAVLR